MTLTYISATRTLTLPEYSGHTAGLQYNLVWPSKTPGDTNVDYSLDVSGWLTEIQDVIGSLTVVSAPNGTGDLVIAQSFWKNGVATVLTSSGNPYTTYQVTLTITTSLNGEILSRTVDLPVLPQA